MDTHNDACLCGQGADLSLYRSGVLQVHVSQTLLPINITWGTVTNPNAQGPMNSDSLGVGLGHLRFLELPSVQLENLFSSSVQSLEDLVKNADVDSVGLGGPESLHF